MQDKKTKEFYDIVIIGAGLSGLTSSALFSKFGISSCVLEMHNIAGGYLQGFERKGFKFDTAIHWLNDCGEKGFVTKTFKIIGNDFPKVKTQKHIRRFVYDDIDYLVTNNPNEFKEELIAKFTKDKKGIEKFFEDALKISKAFDSYINLNRSLETRNVFSKAIYGLKMLKFAMAFIPHIKYKGKEGLKKGLNKYSKNPNFHKIFSAENELLSCLVPIAWAYSSNFQNPPKGGSKAFTDWLLNSSKKMGGDVFFNSKVTEIITENNKVKGVKFLNKGELKEIKCKYVIATCDLETVYTKMLGKDIIPSDKIEKLRNAEIYSSSVTVSIAIDCPAEDLGIGEESVYLFDSENNMGSLSDGSAYSSGIHVLSPSVRDKTLAPEGKGIITLFIPAWIENNNFWNCKKDENGNFIRSEEYRKLKDEYAEILINRVEEKLIPNLKEHILFYDVATPITYLRYTGNKNGTMMGQKPGKENMMNKVASYKTPVKNLFISGHWADLGGGVPIAVKTALNTFLIILQKENKKVFKLLADYVDGKIDINDIKI
ncbi:MAG: NAD(P)/FAD-dependent oxidoreductase [Chlorobi bacterium]|nr:NAD(P)/FAD-dependent oxidoreductase [Chlorobiota bacterium]